MRKRKIPKVVVGAVAVIVLISGGIIGSALAADGAEAAVTDIRVTNLDGTALDAAGVPFDHPIRIDLDVQLPSEAAKSNVLNFTMPSEIFSADMSFPITEIGSGTTVGQCDVVSRVVNCELSADQPGDFGNAKGSISIRDRLNVTGADLDTLVNLDFGLPAVPSPRVVVDGHQTVDAGSALKEGRILTADSVEWEIRIPNSVTVFPIVVEDYPAAGQDCDGAVADVFAYTDISNDANRTVLDTAKAVPNAFGGVDISIAAPPHDTNYQQIGFSYTCKITDLALGAQSNSGFIPDGHGNYHQVETEIVVPFGTATFTGSEIKTDSKVYVSSINEIVMAPTLNHANSGLPYREYVWSPSPSKSTAVIRGVARPFEKIEVYRDRWIKGETTEVEPNCTATANLHGQWSCESPIEAYPQPANGTSRNAASHQVINLRVVRGGETFVGEAEFFSISGYIGKKK